MKKLGSLALGVGALSLVLLNAAMTHGCARSPATQATVPPPSNASAAADAAEADPDCNEPAYMYATKAPVWVPPAKCRGGEPAQQQPSPLVNSAEQQAP